MVTNRFFPRKAYINAISNEKECVVGFTENHDYIVGEIVSFRVTPKFGMFEINKKRGKVLSKTDDTITVDVNTKDWTPFDYSALNDLGTTPPICVPVSSGVLNSVVIIDDAFDNRRV